MKLSKHSIVLAGLLALATSVEAKLCKTVTTDGKVAFMFVDNKPTKTLSGTVSKLANCPQEVEQLKLANPINACERSAQISCEPSFGGLPICTTNNFENFCGFCLVTTKQVNAYGESTVRYINGVIYDGSKLVGDAIACPNKDLDK